VGNEVTLTPHKLLTSIAGLFPEYRFESMDAETHESVIIERVLERGTWAELRWLFDCYGETPIANWLRRHGFRLLSRRSFALWRLVLGIEEYVAPTWAVEAKAMEW
jgi:hypothetical protein